MHRIAMTVEGGPTRPWLLASLLALSLVVPVALAPSAAASDLGAGHPDPTFGDGGYVTSEDRWISGVAVDDTQRIVVVGGSHTGSFVRRYLADGQPDLSFGDAGRVTDVHPDAHGAVDVAVVGSRVFVLARQTALSLHAPELGVPEYFYEDDLVVAALGADGRPDASFGDGGVARIQRPATSETPVALRIDGKGRIVLAGRTDGAGSNILLSRLDAAGRPDADFGIGGTVLHARAVWGSTLQDVEVGPHDDIFALFGGNPEPDHAGTVLRFTTDGLVDRSFGGDGSAEIPFDETAYPRGLAVGSGGDLATVGMALGGNDCCTAHTYLFVARFGADGSPDTGFGHGGLTTLTRWPYLAGDDAVFDDHGRLVVTGTVRDTCPSGVGCDFDVALLRFLPDGSLDDTFGVDGWAPTQDQPLHSGGALTLQPHDGRIVVAAATDGYDVGVARYLSDPVSTVPDAPELSAVQSDDAVDLSWTEPDDGGEPIVGYRLYRATGDGELLLLSSVAGRSFRDGTVEPEVTYRYRVHAVNSVGEGAGSNEATITVVAAAEVPTAPRDLTAATPRTGKGVLLDWDPPASTGSDPLTGYRIYRSSSSQNEHVVAEVSATTTEYRDRSTERGATYTYWVTAFSAAGESPASNEASAVAR